MTQCLTVLFDNALKYSTSRTLLIKNGTSGKENYILVQDRGPGIPEELQRLLFEPFQRGEYARHINPQGCGLGLSVVKAIMLAHGGSVSYRLSRENHSILNYHGLSTCPEKTGSIEPVSGDISATCLRV